jgi:hypothetical protein
MLTLGGGRLEITGDYLQQRDSDNDGSYDASCNGQLNMANPVDYMLVMGKVQFWSRWQPSWTTYPNSLTAGTLEVKGDFIQKSAASSLDNTFSASGTHLTLLSGTGTQAVTFDSPGSSYFNILEVTNRLSHASTVSVSNGGKLKLRYTGTDVVDTLYLGGTRQANGLYDSTNTGGLITGTGKIQVGPFANYSAWTDANAPGQSTDQDHDNDGVANGIEYFMGKTGSDFTANPGIAADGTVTWPTSPAFSGSYTVQTSVDLKEWADVTNDPTQVTKNADSIVWTLRAGPQKHFVRLVVTPN